MKVKVENRKNWQERGDPAKAIKVKGKKSCSSCGKDLEENDFVYISFSDYRFYCNDQNCKPSDMIGNSSETKIASQFEIRYLSNRDRKEVRNEIVKTYKKEGYDMPSDEELEMMVDKRLDSDERIQDNFDEAAVSLESLG